MGMDKKVYYLLETFYDYDCQELAFRGYTSNKWLLDQCERTVEKRFSKQALLSTQITEYSSMRQLYKDRPKITGTDNIGSFPVLNTISPYKGKRIVTTCGDIFESADGGFITYAEKFLIGRDLHELVDMYHSFLLLSKVFNDKKFSDMIMRAIITLYDRIMQDGNANYCNGDLTDAPFAFNLDYFDVVYYGIMKGWYDPI